MWLSEVQIPVCILDLLADFNASAATSISFLTALVKPQTRAFLIKLEISSTALKSPGLEMGKPASKTSTPRWSSCYAITNLVTGSNLQPGTC